MDPKAPLLIALLAVFLAACGCGADQAEYPEPPEDRSAPADAQMTLRLTGSEGGTFRVERSDVFGETIAQGRLGSEPVEYAISPEKPPGTVADYRAVNLAIYKDDPWEGKLYAVLFVDGAVAHCANTEDPSEDLGIYINWNTGDGKAGPLMRAICGSYRFFD